MAVGGSIVVAVAVVVGIVDNTVVVGYIAAEGCIVAEELAGNKSAVVVVYIVAVVAGYIVAEVVEYIVVEEYIVVVVGECKLAVVELLVVGEECKLDVELGLVGSIAAEELVLVDNNFAEVDNMVAEVVDNHHSRAHSCMVFVYLICIDPFYVFLSKNNFYDTKKTSMILKIS